MTSTIQAKPHYAILDGLRGVAALIVVLLHICEFYGVFKNITPYASVPFHGYLAVDFFFALSGYVIGYAYDDRWGKMGILEFFKRRLVRLHPMVIFSTILGALFFYFQNKPDNVIAGTPASTMLLLTALGFTMLPLGALWNVRGFICTYPMNDPIWTLMWEYIANIFYALFIHKLPRWALAIFVAGTAILTLNLTLNWNFFDIFNDAKRSSWYAAYTVAGGWDLSCEGLVIGTSRLLFPFFSGLLLARYGAKFKIPGGFWTCVAITAGILLLPRLGSYENPGELAWLNGLYEATAIIIAFPLILAMGAGSNVHGKISSAICKFLGDISYPLYLCHMPFVMLLIAWKAHNPDAPVGAQVVACVATYLLSIATAYAALKVYDVPVRKWLANKFLK